MKALSILFILVIITISCGCQKTEPPAISSMSQHEDEMKTSETVPGPELYSEDNLSPLFALWQPDLKPTLDTIPNTFIWNGYLNNCIRMYPSSYKRGDTVRGAAYNIMVFLLQRGMADLLPQMPPDQYGEKYLILTIQEFQFLVERFYGAEMAASILDEMSYEVDKIDYEAGTVYLRVNEYEREMSFDDRYLIKDIIPLSDNGTDKMRLVVEMYEYVDGKNELDSIHTYDLYWDDMVGYLPSEIIWEYTPTSRTSVTGNVRLFDTLWGYEAGSNELIIDRSPNPVKITTLGNIVYHFYYKNSFLKADTLNMTTLEQSTNQTIHNFSGEEVMGVHGGEQGIIVYTDTAAYLLDNDLRPQSRKPFPSGIPLQEAVQLTFCRDISKVAYSLDDGIYLCDMAESAKPLLLQKHPKKESIVESEYLYPIRFLDGDRLFVGVSMWERNGYYLILDFDGNARDTIPFFVSGEHSGGYIFHNQAGAIHFFNDYNIDERKSYAKNSYYDFSTEKLESADWLTIQYGWSTKCIADPASPYGWYFSLPQGDWGSTERSNFVRVDTQKQTVTELPFSVIGADAVLLAAGDDGNILFMYTYKGERGFGVY